MCGSEGFMSNRDFLQSIEQTSRGKYIGWADSRVTLDWIQVENVKQKLFAGN